MGLFEHGKLSRTFRGLFEKRWPLPKLEERSSRAKEQAKNSMLNALVRNCRFKMVRVEELPAINFVYPADTADGNVFRFSPELEKEPSERTGLVKQNLSNKRIVYTSAASILLGVGKIAPRLGLRELIHGEIISAYSLYVPLLFVGMDKENFVVYVVKFTANAQTVWFELTQQETEAVRDYLSNKAKGRL